MSILLSLMLALAALAGAEPPAAQATSSPELSPFRAQRIAPGVHLLRTPSDFLGPAIGNITVIEQEKGVVIIDTGATIDHGRRVVRFVRSITSKPVKAVVFTHWHNDHPLGAAGIKEAWPRAEIIATAATRNGIRGPAATAVGPHPDEKWNASMLKQVSRAIEARRTDTSTPERLRAFERMKREMEEFGRSFRGTFYVLPTRLVESELVLEDGERPVRIKYLGRANTGGDLVAWLPRQKIVVTGDIVVAPSPFGYFSYPGEWIEVIKQLKAIGFQTLIPGHGEPQTDSRYLDRLIATIADICSQVGPLARQGLSIEQIRERTDFSVQTAIFGTTPRLRSTFESNWLTPMVENAYKEALGRPIVQGGENGDTSAASNREKPAMHESKSH